VLLAEIDRMCADADWRRRVLGFCQGIDAAAAARFHTAIHPADPMLLHSLREHRDAGAAFSQYFAIALQQHSMARQILRVLFGPQASALDVLDFACGHGRLLRFLVLSLPPERIWAVDLQPDAVEFVSRAFGVHAAMSDEDPSRFTLDRRFDFIWVASLFSHLPEHLFHAWLARLVGMLTPRGVLCFSVRDGTSDAGIRYTTDSENARLAGAIYGTTYAGAAFVREALRRATGDERGYCRIRRALANEQDLYIVAGDPRRDLSGLESVRHGAWGWVDVRTLSCGELRLAGWAASLDDGPVDRVEIEIDGALHASRPTIPRPDVAAAFDAERLLRSGWSFVAEPCDKPSVRVCVGAATTRGERALLYAGEIRAAS
jgi:trans-aconitate methyltransferase